MHIHHITINTGHSHRSERGEVSDATIKIMQQWLADMLAGRPRAMTNTGNVACRVGRHNGKMIEFVVSIGHAEQADALRFVVCRHSKAKAEAWALAGGAGNPPQTPFLAANLLMPELEMMQRGASFDDIMMLADFERCLAWAWLESKT
ncbi:hypothetical protein [Neisseria shayeganii]|uniref:Uncharacterized protein n=1 Tax=Neisseria shayeganii 871 TaxID=1032488 RepID=G4CH25_9NEIS|nr:hypothetical protein [Neisseria shayeganii]EGY52863.1 hypothetical protein HMPREF9371_0914 [Neisseria shayeganii 871]